MTITLTEQEAEELHALLACFPHFFFNPFAYANGQKGALESESVIHCSLEAMDILKRIQHDISGRQQCPTRYCLGEIGTYRDADTDEIYTQCDSCAEGYHPISEH